MNNIEKHFKSQQQAQQESLERLRLLHVILPLFIGSVIAYLDRVNLAYAALTMNKDLGFSAPVFDMGAGIFFAGYVLFEIPGALIAERWSARVWLARIMVSWGPVSCGTIWMRNEGFPLLTPVVQLLLSRQL